MLSVVPFGYVVCVSNFVKISYTLLCASYLRISYRYVIVFSVSDRLVQYCIPYKPICGWKGWKCILPKMSEINGLQEQQVLPYMTLFQCSRLVVIVSFVPHRIPFFALVRIASLSCKSNNVMNVYV